MKHLFVPLASILFLTLLNTSTQGAEPSRPSQKQALNTWRTHCQDQNIDLDAKRQELSSFTWSYEYLLDKGFDVFSIEDYRGQVFTDIRVTIEPNDHYLMNHISQALHHEKPWITSLTIDGFYDKRYKNETSSFRLPIPSLYPKDLDHILAPENLCLQNLSLCNYFFSSNASLKDEKGKSDSKQWDDLSTAISQIPQLKSFTLSNCRLPEDNFIDGILKITQNQKSLEELCLNNLTLNLHSATLLKFIPALENSSITRLYLPNIPINSDVCDSLVTLLNNGKTFDVLCLARSLWIGFFPTDSYNMVKSIGMAATGKVKHMEHLGLVPYNSPVPLSRESFDYSAYNPTYALLSDIGKPAAALGAVTLFVGLFVVALHKV